MSLVIIKIVRNKHPKINLARFIMPSSVGPDVVPPTEEETPKTRKSTVSKISAWMILLNMIFG